MLYIIIPIEKEIFRKSTYPHLEKNRYEISNYGNVKDLKLNRIKQLSPHKSNNYICGKFKCDNGKKRCIQIHRLVAWEFCEGYDEEQERTIVNHLNGNRTNNYYQNLEWVTISENCLHRYKIGSNHTNPPIYYGSEHPSNVYDEKLIRDICVFLKNKCSVKEIKYSLYKKYNISIKKLFYLITDIKYKKSWEKISNEYF